MLEHVAEVIKKIGEIKDVVEGTAENAKEEALRTKLQLSETETTDTQVPAEGTGSLAFKGNADINNSRMEGLRSKLSKLSETDETGFSESDESAGSLALKENMNIEPDALRTRLSQLSEANTKDTKWSAENNNSIAFKGSGDTYNYEYYKHEAELHKQKAEAYDRDAQNRFGWAESYSDNPSKAQQYINEGRNWASKAASEYQAYRDALKKADSYK